MSRLQFSPALFVVACLSLGVSSLVLAQGQQESPDAGTSVYAKGFAPASLSQVQMPILLDANCQSVIAKALVLSPDA